MEWVVFAMFLLLVGGFAYDRHIGVKEHRELISLLARRLDHEERIERVRNGLSEVRTKTLDEDPPPAELVDLCAKFKTSGMSMLNGAIQLHRSGVPWDKVMATYVEKIGAQAPDLVRHLRGGGNGGNAN